MSDSDAHATPFKVCSICRAPIPFGGAYYSCSVSTCNRPRTAFYFCSVSCWDAHVPSMRHRDAWAEDARAPTRSEWLAAEAQRSEIAHDVTRKIPRPQSPAATSTGSPADPARTQAPRLSPDDFPEDVLVVVSKLKAYVKARSDLKTSDTVIPVLSDILRQVCDEAILHAREAGRQTVLDRDIPRRWRPLS